MDKKEDKAPTRWMAVVGIIASIAVVMLIFAVILALNTSATSDTTSATSDTTEGTESGSNALDYVDNELIVWAYYESDLTAEQLEEHLEELGHNGSASYQFLDCYLITLDDSYTQDELHTLADELELLDENIERVSLNYIINWDPAVLDY